MPKLFQINTVANWGSTGRIAEGIGQVALAKGWQCHMAYGRGTPKSCMQLVPVGTQCNLYRNALLARLFDNEGLNAHRATRRLISTMRRVKPDVVHLHNLLGYYLNYPLLFSYLAEADVPVVWTLHDCWSLTGHCTYFDFAGCEKWRTGCSHCPQLGEYPPSFGWDGSHRNFRLKRHWFNQVRRLTLVPVSDWLANLVRQSHLGGHTVHRIYNGVDLQQFRPTPEAAHALRSKLGITTPHFVLGVASTWTRRKGLADFVALRRELPAHEVSIVLLGLTPEQIRRLPAGIIGLQRTDSIADMVGLYSAADIVLNLSREETFGMTTAEGFACGTPSIVFDCTASPELIDADTGLIIAQGDTAALAEAVLRLCRRPEPEAMRTACRARAERLYDRNERFAEYVRLYEDLRGNP